MPSVQDIVTVAEALEKSPILVVRDNCVAVRNRNATCRRCVNACIAGAIDVCGNEVTLDVSLCNACGACAAACPTEALVSVRPSNAQIAEFLTTALDAAGGKAVFACARIASKRTANPEAYVEVPCLSRVDETAVLTAAVLGAQSVVLVDGDCATCKYREYAACGDIACAYARELLAAQGSEVVIERATGFPDDMLIESPEGVFGTTRRGFFSEAVGAAKETAMTAARTTVVSELGLDTPEAAIGQRLRVTEEGTLPLVRVPRHEAAINALDALGAPCVESFESRLFGSVQVDVSKCNSCTMCATFCPTGALRRDPADAIGAPLRYLEFSACDCVQCGLCADVCWKDAVKLSTIVSTDQLFDFEPVTFTISASQRKAKSMFG